MIILCNGSYKLYKWKHTSRTVMEIMMEYWNFRNAHLENTIAEFKFQHLTLVSNILYDWYLDRSILAGKKYLGFSITTSNIVHSFRQWK